MVVEVVTCEKKNCFDCGGGSSVLSASAPQTSVPTSISRCWMMTPPVGSGQEHAGHEEDESRSKK